jgi:excisionase family DNA binding protein
VRTDNTTVGGQRHIHMDYNQGQHRQVPTPEQSTDPAGTSERGEMVELLTVNEVAATLRVSKMTVYRLIHAGQLEAIRIGQSLRLPRGAVETFLGEVGLSHVGDHGPTTTVRL